jgi:hypothetical protein
MDELSDKTVLVYDYGNNIHVARKLTSEFGRVRYFRPWKESEPKVSNLVVGDGFDGVERVRHFHDAIASTDLFIFPCIYDGDLQRDLVNRGKRVWGARKAERLEYDRPFFMEALAKAGMPVPDYTVCTGMDELERLLKRSEHGWVKSNYRGDDETWQHINWELSQWKVAALRHRFGPTGKHMVFTVVPDLEADFESAYDGYMVTSPSGKPQFPDIGFLGYETKDRSHILTAIPYESFPDEVRDINDQFAPQLAKYFFRSAWGTEIRGPFFLDATCRQPSPPGELITYMVQNLGEFMWHGSEGDLVPLDVPKTFGVEVILYSECSKTNWMTFDIPEDIDDAVKLFRCCRDDDGTHIIPDGDVTGRATGMERVGAVVATGDTIEDAIDSVKETCEQLKAMYLICETDSLAECLKRIQAGQEEGIKFTKQAIPEPATVLED